MREREIRRCELRWPFACVASMMKTKGVAAHETLEGPNQCPVADMIDLDQCGLAIFVASFLDTGAQMLNSG